jgi:hypothetical protein
VEVPCASQLRELFGRLATLGRLAFEPFAAAPFTVLRPMAARLSLLKPPFAEGGRLRDSSFCLEFMGGLLALALAPKPARPVFTCVRPATLLRGELPWNVPARPGDKFAVFMVRTCERASTARGAMRAITVRFCTEAGGVTTRVLAFTSPKWLCRVGEMPMLLFTRAPRSEASVTCTELRLMRSPFTKLLRDATVTARVLWA